MSATQQLNHSVRQLEDTNKYLPAPWHASITNLQKFSSQTHRHPPLSFQQRGSLLGMWVPLLTTCSCWGCGHSCFRGVHAAPYNHLTHPLVGRHPSRSPAVPQTGGCCTGSGQRCDASRVTAVSARLGFHCCSVPALRSYKFWSYKFWSYKWGLTNLLPYKFLCFFCTSFQIDSFFVSKFSLSFPGYHLIQLMVVVLFSMISWGLMVVSPCSKISLG